MFRDDEMERMIEQAIQLTTQSNGMALARFRVRLLHAFERFQRFEIVDTVRSRTERRNLF